MKAITSLFTRVLSIRSLCTYTLPRRTLPTKTLSTSTLPTLTLPTLALFVFGLFFTSLAQAQTIQSAYKNRQSDVQIKGQGTVVKILPDDNKGSRHQKFILKVSSGHTILVAHNIDLAPRINSIAKGDTVYFYGEYEWNKKGGVVHWTHRDPANRHAHGWLKHKNKVYK